MSDDPRPKLDLTDIPKPPVRPTAGAAAGESSGGGARPFLSVQFNCCKVYQRVYASPDGKRYEGRCPRCLQTIRFVVGEGGTTDRSFVVE